MGGRDKSGDRCTRVSPAHLRWIGAGILGLGLLTQACGKTARRGSTPHADGEAGASSVVAGGAHFDEPVSAGESSGGSDVGGSSRVGGAAGVGGATGEAGGPSPEGGAPPEPRRPITARVVDPVTGPVEAMKLYIDGETFVSDADGIVHATAPLGEYDVVILDTTLGGAQVESPTGLQVYQGITTATPVFSLPRDYETDGGSKAQGTVKGTYPDGLFGGIGFDAQPAQLAGMSSNVTAGAYHASAGWYLMDVNADGHLMALFWSRNADSQPTAFWFGQTAVKWGPSLPLVATDIDVAALPSKELALQIKVPAGTHAYGTFNTGPGGASRYNGTSFSWTAGADAALGATTHLVPQEPLPNPALHTSLELLYGENLGDSKLPTGNITTRIPANAAVLALDEVNLPTLLEPADGAKKIAATTKFTFEALANTCHVVRISMPHPGYVPYDVTIHTARGEFTPPDLSSSGQFWPSAQTGNWSVTSTGPCPSMDALVTPSEVVPDTSTRFWLGARTFTTAR